jgi:hypothetical protein
VIETGEEERLRTILGSISNQARLTFFEWGLTRGLTRGLTKADPPASPNCATAQPLNALKRQDHLILDGVFLLKNFARYLRDPMVARTIPLFHSHREDLDRLRASAQGRFVPV